jgi:hypothetical protein
MLISSDTDLTDQNKDDLKLMKMPVSILYSAAFLVLESIWSAKNMTIKGARTPFCDSSFRSSSSSPDTTNESALSPLNRPVNYRKKSSSNPYANRLRPCRTGLSAEQGTPSFKPHPERLVVKVADSPPMLLIQVSGCPRLCNDMNSFQRHTQGSHADYIGLTDGLSRNLSWYGLRSTP